MNNSKANAILNTYLHVQDDGRTEAIPVSASFWQEVMKGDRPELNQGRLMSALAFSQPWPHSCDDATVLDAGSGDGASPCVIEA
jgi:hypothetical protein